MKQLNFLCGGRGAIPCRFLPTAVAECMLQWLIYAVIRLIINIFCNKKPKIIADLQKLCNFANFRVRGVRTEAENNIINF
ncbi:MAG: hypothetical protein ACI35T_03415 [Alistipes sp.]